MSDDTDIACCRGCFQTRSCKQYKEPGVEVMLCATCWPARVKIAEKARADG